MKKETKNYIDLIKTFSIYLLKEQNVNNYLSILQFLFMPILISLIILFSFAHKIGEDIYLYRAFLLFGMILWQLFSGVVGTGKIIIDNYKYIIKSVKFPIETIIFGNFINLLLIHLFSVLILIGIMYVFNYNVYGFIWYPLILFFYSFFLVGISFIVIFLDINLKFMKNFWGLIITSLWLFTPVFYQLKQGTLHYTLNQFNPLYQYITISREIIIYNKIPNFDIIIFMMAFSLLVFVFGYSLFIKNKEKFPEKI
ncbi:MAG: ABC transporter permease [Candidatus Pacearchaeota archaeon]